MYRIEVDNYFNLGSTTNDNIVRPKLIAQGDFMVYGGNYIRKGDDRGYGIEKILEVLKEMYLT